MCEEILGEARKPGEVLYPLLQFINGSKDGKTWGEVRAFMIEKGFAGPGGKITMLMRPPQTFRGGTHPNSALGGYTTKSEDGKYKINDSGKKKLKELEEKNKK